MPTEISRKTHVQWILSLGVGINIIDEITFIDPDQQYQQFTWTLNNPYRLSTDTSDDTTRKTHVVGFFPFDTDPAPDGNPGTVFNVEIIDKMKLLDSREQSQEYWYTFKGPADDTSNNEPPKHRKTHVSTIIPNIISPISTIVTPANSIDYPDFQTVVAVERVDEVSFIDPMNQYQESIYKLDWSNEAKDDLNLVIPDDQYADLSIDTNAQILRLDPFQTILGVNQISLGTHVHITWTGSGSGLEGFDTVDVGNLKAGLHFSSAFGMSTDAPLVDVVDYDSPPPKTWRIGSASEFFGGIYPDSSITTADGNIQSYGAPTSKVSGYPIKQNVHSLSGILQGYITYNQTLTNEYYVGWVKVARS